ncbi:MAG: lipopolysaccharide biosynthesis protein [Saccharospirillum sp.]|nr:lipopolysaccharide biosynthesis protein [Saccharospirillum sp.]
MKDFKHSVINALAVSGGAKIVSQLLTVVFTIWLARLLTPTDFGIIAMIAVFTGMAHLMADVGLGSALIQNRNTTEAHFSTVFWFNSFLGAIMTVTFIALAPYIATFYNTPIIEPILGLLAFQFLINAFALVPQQRLIKNLHFGKIAIANITAMVISNSLGVYMALQGYGVWALVWKALAHASLITLVIYTLAGWWPKLIFSIRALTELFMFSIYVLGTELLQYLTKNLDGLIVGRILGPEPAGLLDRAKSLKTLPLANISHVLGSVMFPALSLLKDDIPRVKAVYLRSTGAIAFITFPMMLGLLAVADNFVIGLLGVQWSKMITPFQILCLAGIASTIVTVTGSVYKSQGASKLQFHTSLITKPITIILVVIGVNWGLHGVVVALTTATWINSFIQIKRAGSLINLTVYQLVQPLVPTLIISITMGIAVYLIGISITNYSEVTTLLIQVSAGAVLYALLACIVKPSASLDIIHLIKERFMSTSSSNH